MSKKLDQAFQNALNLGCQCKCGQQFVREGNSLLCPNGHRIDGNKKGYFNFLSKPVSDAYTARLFEARSHILNQGFFDGILAFLLPEIREDAKILDCGTGDGYFLRSILSQIPGSSGAGIDLSRYAIEQAADLSALWCVADLRSLPFPDHLFDVILDILSPADYREFRRVLAPSGKLIKVIPGREHLREIREARKLSPVHESLSEEHLAKEARILRREERLKTFSINETEWQNFISMTPLNQDLTEDEQRELAMHPSPTITVHFILITAAF